MIDKIKKIWKLIKELNSTPRGKAVLFFGFYAIFFIVLFIIMAIGKSNNNYSLDDIYNTNKISFSSIDSNFEYSYKFYIDNNIYTYDGKKRNNEETFIFNNAGYYNKNGDFYQNDGGNYVEVDSPFIYREFTDNDVIKQLIDVSSFSSKTEYENGDMMYNYKITTSTIVKELDDIDTDIDDVPNEISIYVSKDGNIKNIKFNLNSYGLFKSISMNKFEIELSYFNYGEVDDFNILAD